MATDQRTTPADPIDRIEASLDRLKGALPWLARFLGVEPERSQQEVTEGGSDDD